MSQPNPQVIFCPNCGNANPASASNCLKCGQPLPSLASGQTAPPAPGPSPVLPPPPAAGPATPPYNIFQKSRGTSLLLEILPWLVGFLGVGWLYAGNTNTGILWLAGFLIWNVIAVIIDVVTLGLFLCLHGPVNIALLILSAVQLNNYMRLHPDQFRP